MKLNFDPSCNCPDLRTVMLADIHGVRPERCPTHQADLIAADAAADARASADEHRDALADAFADLRAKSGDEDAQADQDRREAALDDLATRDPLLASLTRATGAQVLPLNAPASAYPSLAGLTEADPTTPLDAA